MSNRVIIIGGGASGMMSAGIAGKRGKEVILLEKNNKLGRKILISGKGRCNLTNNADIDELINNIPGNGHFLYSAFYTFSNHDLINFFEDYGVRTKVERGGRIFPVSDKAGDIVLALEKFMNDYNVDVRLNSEVKDIVKNNNQFIVTLWDNQTLTSDKLIISTGGITYRATGSTGDGYRFAKSFGHTIKPLKPSLVPLVSDEEWIPQLQGLSLKNVSITMFKNNKKIYNDFGEMLFTHYGLSGPIILSSSRKLVDVDFTKQNINIIIDLKPALTEEQLDKRIYRDFEKYKNKIFKNCLNDLLPQKLIPIIIRLSSIDENTPINQITKVQRNNLTKLLKNLPVNIVDTRPINEGIITCGGVLTNQINPSTMESKLIKGLFFTGEVIDVDGYTGGFNLQIAFSTGYTAGLSV